MGRLITRRLVFVVFVLWGVSLITFVLSRVVPGDPARLIAESVAGHPARFDQYVVLFGVRQPSAERVGVVVPELLAGRQVPGDHPRQ